MTHPLERLKRIADETIRKQAIENFNQEYYDENSKNDNGNLESAIMWSFDWLNSPQKYDYWNQIWNLSINNQLELLPEPIEGDDFYCKTKYSENFLCEEQCDACKKADELTIPEPIEDNPTLGDKTSLANVDIYEQNTQLKLENEKLREFAANYVTHVENNIINNVYSADELTLLIPFVNLKDQAKQLLNQK